MQTQYETKNNNQHENKTNHQRRDLSGNGNRIEHIRLHRMAQHGLRLGIISCSNRVLHERTGGIVRGDRCSDSRQMSI